MMASEAAAEELEWLVRGRSLVPGVAAQAVKVVDTFEARVATAGDLRRDIQHLMEKIQKLEHGVAHPGLYTDLTKVWDRQQEHTGLLRIEAAAAMRAIAAYLGFSYAELTYLAKEEAERKRRAE